MERKILFISAVFLIGIFIGWLVFQPSRKNEDRNDNSRKTEKSTIWTCAMHPQIRMNEPGDCPICGMDLVPLGPRDTTSIDPDVIHISNDAAHLANVMTSVVTRQEAVKEVRLYGKIQADERLLQTQVAHFPGRIEKLYVNFTGESVKKGQSLAEIYSPELITAQQELLETSKTKQIQPELYEASRDKLRQWKLTDDQIEKIENSGITQTTLEVVSNTNGIVASLLANNGDYVLQGSPLFKIADLSKVWILFDAYESDLQFLKKGGRINFTIQALPGINFKGVIAFVDPFIDPVTRVAKVRVETDNQTGKLKPEMFASGEVSSSLDEYRNSVVIPRSAVLWTGKRSIVYVKQPDTDEPLFKIREIGLGPMLGESYVVTYGLTEGERIVTSGAFSVDAAAQLEGKTSMMNPAGGNTSISINSPRTDEQFVGLNNDQDESRANGAKKSINVSMDFVMQVNTIYDRYIDMKNALVNSNAEKALQSAIKVKEALAKIDLKLLPKDAQIKWMDIVNSLDKNIGNIASSNEIEAQRVSFSEISDHLYTVIKTFGLLKKTVYYQFCPMAKDGQGAYWLSESEAIRNPYFGEQMLDCGETRETLNY